MENNNNKKDESSKMDANPRPNNNNSENPNPSSRRLPFTNLSQVDADLALARTLQDQERAYMMLRMNDVDDDGSDDHESWVTDDDQDDDDDDDDRQDTWDDVDPDELSYEELIALGEVVGTQSRGLSADSIASLRSMTYKTQNGSSEETCVICRLDYDDGDNLILLSCKHSYHSDCITNWLQINKVCPVCSTDVSTSS